MQAIRFTMNDEGLQSSSADGSPEEIVSMARQERKTAEVFLLCAADSLDSNGAKNGVAMLREHVNYREAQNKAKTLSSYLLGKKGIPAVKAKYTRHQTCLNAIEQLLADADSCEQEQKAFVVFVEPKLFSTLYSQTGGLPSTGARSRRKFGNLRVLDDALCREVLRERMDQKVPARLQEWYIGKSPQIDLVRRLILRAGAVNCPVLITGESGTGKERIARAVFDYGTIGRGEFVAANCAAIPSEMMESELFGHVKGAYTHAVRDRLGLWRKADGGTLFLDEIGDLALSVQAKMLRALQEGVVRPLGEEREFPTNARIIAATNHDLRAMVKMGTFREDLYYRLCAFMIQAPSLREHREDIKILAGRFWQDITQDGKSRLPRDVMAELEQIEWPGNVRELRAFLLNLYAIGGKNDLDLALVRSLLYQRRGPLIK